MNSYSEKITPILNKIILVSLFTFAAFSMFSISIAQIAAGVGGLAWLFRTHLTESWSEQRWPLGISFGLYVLACLIAVADAYDVGYSYPALKKLFEILIFFWVINCVQRKRLRNSLIILLIISATVAGLYGLYQAWQNGIHLGARVEGTMSTYMTFAGLLMIAGMLSFGRMIFRRPHEMWLWPSVAIIAVCLLFTLTRQAWFGFLTGLTFLLFTWEKKLFLIFSVSIMIVVLMFSQQVTNGIQNLVSGEPDPNNGFMWNLKYRFQDMLSGNDSTFSMRKALWLGGWEIFKDHPLTGCGFSCVDLVHSQYPDPTGLIARLRGMHNNFVQLAVDTGILGLSAWMGIWFCFFSLLYKRVTALKGDSHERGVILGSMAAALAFLAGGFFESNFYDSEVVMLLYLVMALPFAGSTNDKIESVEKA
jgi:O-antigen ligase